MPRRKRLQIAGLPTHIIQRGNNRQACFFADDDYQFFLYHLAQLAKRFRCALHAYVLMSNHFHLLLTSVTPFFVFRYSSSLRSACAARPGVELRQLLRTLLQPRELSPVPLLLSPGRQHLGMTHWGLPVVDLLSGRSVCAVLGLLWCFAATI